MNDTTEIPIKSVTPEGTDILTGASTTDIIEGTDVSAEPPAAAVVEPVDPRPRIRIGAVVWGLLVSIVAATTILIVLDPARSQEVADWAANVSAETIGLIALVALGALLLLLGLVSLLRHAQRRGERA